MANAKDCKGDKRKMKLSGELDYRIRYDVEHDLFHAQNVFNDEYIKPTFIEYVQKIEKENAELKNRNQELLESCEGATMMYEHLTKAKEIIEDFMITETGGIGYSELYDKAEQFLNSEVEK